MSDERENAACRDTFDLVHGFVIASMQGELAEDEITDFEQLLRDRPDARRLYAVYLADTIKLPAILSAAVAGSQSGGPLGDGIRSGKPLPAQPNRAPAPAAPAAVAGLGVLGRSRRLC